MIIAGAPTAGTSAMVTPTSHCGQRSRVSFRINGRERRFPSQLTEDQKSKVCVSSPHYLYHKVNRSSHSKPTTKIVRCMLGILTSLPSKPCNGPLVASVD
jgi:hypothetical protein